LLTKDTSEESLERMIQRSDISRDDAQKLADELIKQGEAQYEELEKAFRGALSQGLKSMDITRNEAFQKLQERVDRLEKKVFK
jgi:polyhydroxyalkanoate synthesis regulator phasin